MEAIASFDRASSASCITPDRLSLRLGLVLSSRRQRGVGAGSQANDGEAVVPYDRRVVRETQNRTWDTHSEPHPTAATRSPAAAGIGLGGDSTHPEDHRA